MNGAREPAAELRGDRLGAGEVVGDLARRPVGQQPGQRQRDGRPHLPAGGDDEPAAQLGGRARSDQRVAVVGRGDDDVVGVVRDARGQRARAQAEAA